MTPKEAGYTGTKIAQEHCRVSELGDVQYLTGQGFDLLHLF